MARLTSDQWQAIRNCWEYDPDLPSHEVAACRAGDKFKFKPPSKSNVYAKCQKDDWERKGSMNGITAAAHRKADAMVDPSGNRTFQNQQNQICGVKQNTVLSPALTQSSREEAVDKRAEVTARHRTEWFNVAVLRQEALAIRNSNPDGAMAKMKLAKMKLAKLTAETTSIQQAGERKAWGLDILVDVGSLEHLTDKQLEDIIKGKVVFQ